MVRRMARIASGSRTVGSAALAQRASPRQLKAAAAPVAVRPIEVCLTEGSALGDAGLAKLLAGLAGRLGLPVPQAGGHVDGRLLERLLSTAARQLRIGPHAASATGRRPGTRKLVARCRTDGRSDDRILYDGRSATAFRESQRLEAEAWLEAQIEIENLEVLGKIIPTQFPVDKVLDQLLADKKPAEPVKEREAINYATLVRRVANLRTFYANRRLIDVVGSAEAYVAHRVAMRGRTKLPDGSFENVSRDTAGRELELFQSALNALRERFGCMWIPKLNIPSRKKPRATFMLGKEVTRLLLAARGWTWDYEAKDWSWRRVWDPNGRDIEWDEELGVVRVVDKGFGAFVNRPVVDFAYRRSAMPLKRMVLIGVYTGTRHLALLRLRWTRNGEHGWFDLGRRVLHRADVRHGQTTKKQPSIVMPEALRHYAEVWSRLDGGAGPVIRKRNGTGYATYLNQQFAKLVERAGLREMEVSDDDRRFIDDAGEPIDVVFHVLRHTCATWLRELGVPLSAAADFLGMSERTLQRVYGHWTVAGTMTAASALDAVGWSPLRPAILQELFPTVAVLPPILKAFPPQSKT